MLAAPRSSLPADELPSVPVRVMGHPSHGPWYLPVPGRTAIAATLGGAVGSRVVEECQRY
jgi:hypothetical protein